MAYSYHSGYTNQEEEEYDDEFQFQDNEEEELHEGNNGGRQDAGVHQDMALDRPSGGRREVQDPPPLTLSNSQHSDQSMVRDLFSDDYYPSHAAAAQPAARSKEEAVYKTASSSSNYYNNKGSTDPPAEQHYSPTDPMEFDQLIHNSLNDEEYYNQYIQTTTTPRSAVSLEDNEALFDPFNLQGVDVNGSFPKVVLSSSVELVCPLPSKDADDEDDDQIDDELTMGELIEHQQAAGWPVLDMSVVSNYTEDDQTISTKTGGEADSLAFSESIGGVSKKSKMSKRVKAKVRNLVTSFSGGGSSSVISGTTSIDNMSLEDVVLTPNEPYGPNMSLPYNNYNDDSNTIQDEAEIKTFLAIASTFTAMSENNIIQTELSNSQEEEEESVLDTSTIGSSSYTKSSQQTTRLVPLAKSRSNETDEQNEAIDCFQTTTEVQKGGNSRSNRQQYNTVEVEDDGSASTINRGIADLQCCNYFDAVLDNMGENIDNALKACGI